MNNAAKFGIAAFFGILSAYFGIAVIPMILLLVLMIIDYITGISSAWISGTLCSRKSITGILKKVGYLAVIAIGVTCDLLIEYAFSAIGQDISISFAVGLVIVIWLILNECISILENLAQMDVPIPKFLKGIIKRLKVVTEETIIKPDKDDTDDHDST